MNHNFVKKKSLKTAVKGSSRLFIVEEFKRSARRRKKQANWTTGSHENIYLYFADGIIFFYFLLIYTEKYN